MPKLTNLPPVYPKTLKKNPTGPWNHGFHTRFKNYEWISWLCTSDLWWNIIISLFATPRPQFATRTMRILSRISKNSHRNGILLDFRIGDCEAQGAVIWCVVDRKSIYNNETWKQMIIHHVRQWYHRFLKILTSIWGWDFLISILGRKVRSDVKIKLIFVFYAKFCINIDLGTYFRRPLV